MNMPAEILRGKYKFETSFLDLGVSKKKFYLH